MDVREKLVELLNNSFAEQYEKRGLLTAPHTATDLIAKGVTVQEECNACATATQEVFTSLQRKIAELNKAQEWISVKDRLPETTIRCIVSKHNVPFLAYWDGEKWRETNKLMVVDGVTHWMPIPQPPKGE